MIMLIDNVFGIRNDKFEFYLTNKEVFVVCMMLQRLFLINSFFLKYIP